MQQKLIAILEDMHSSSVDERYMANGSSMRARVEEYSFRGYVHGGRHSLPGVIIDPSRTPYAVVLQACRNGNKKDIAVGNFDVVDSMLDCLQIQGKAGCYRELTPARWDRAILDTLVGFGRAAGASEVRIVPASYFSSATSWEIPRFEKRYDTNARQSGFIYNQAQRRFILVLK